MRGSELGRLPRPSSLSQLQAKHDLATVPACANAMLFGIEAVEARHRRICFILNGYGKNKHEKFLQYRDPIILRLIWCRPDFVGVIQEVDCYPLYSNSN